MFGGGLNTIGVVAEEDLVQIERKNLVLGEVLFYADRQRELFELALEGLLRGEEQTIGYLLCDRRAALHHAPRAQVRQRGAHDPHEVDTLVIVEAAVLGGEEGEPHVIG